MKVREMSSIEGFGKEMMKEKTDFDFVENLGVCIEKKI